MYHGNANDMKFIEKYFKLKINKVISKEFIF